MSDHSPAVRLFAVSVLAASALAAPAAGAQSARCRALCDATITLMPGALRTHVLRGPVVRTLATGADHRLPGTTSFEIIVAAAARTPVPRVSVFGSAQWLPNASAARNPFTLYTASELGTHVHANAPTLVGGASVSLVAAPETRGWLDLAANVGDLFSQAARPDDRASYTHKLDLALVAHVHAFAWAPPPSYLHRVSVYAILDRVATGLPRAGDEVPEGRRFVTDARPTALVVGLALPVTAPRR